MLNKRFTVEESNLISIFMEEGIDSDVGGRKKVINGSTAQGISDAADGGICLQG